MQCFGVLLPLLIHWGRNKVDAIVQTIFSNVYLWMKMNLFLYKFPWSLFPMIQLATSQHWFRWWLGAIQATNHYLSQWCPSFLAHLCVIRSRYVNTYSESTCSALFCMLCRLCDKQHHYFFHINRGINIVVMKRVYLIFSVVHHHLTYDRRTTYPECKVNGANMGPTWSCRPQMGPMLAPWTLLSGEMGKFGVKMTSYTWDIGASFLQSVTIRKCTTVIFCTGFHAKIFRLMQLFYFSHYQLRHKKWHWISTISWYIHC